jgi:hypothetical protein
LDLWIARLAKLTVVFPNGIFGCVYGPNSARENDNGALNGSELNQHLIDLQEEIKQAQERGEQVLYFSLYGNAIFPLLHCITHRHRAPIGRQLNARQIAEDTGMSQIRTSAEWPYETITNLFHVLHSKYNKHFLRRDRTVNDIIHKQLRVLFFLYNCYTCLNGSKFSRFFDVQAPNLEDYLQTILE